MKRSHCNFFYLPSGRAFHRPDCPAILYSSVPPSGTVYFTACEKTGRTPCKICRPKPDDAASHKRRKSAECLPQARLAPAEIQLQLTRAELQAMKRHRQASRERARLDLSSMTERQRADALTLTATRFAFWAAPGYSNFHTRNCVKLNGVENVRGFARYEDALRAGFSPCRHCRPSAKQDAVLSIPIYNQTRSGERIEDVLSLCRAKGFQYSLEKNELQIETRVGRWFVNIRKRPVFVEHQHLDVSVNKKSSVHWQPRMFLSLRDAVEYISRHDEQPSVEKPAPEENE